MSNILIGITNVVLFFFWGFFSGGPSVTSKAPSAAKPGESFLVEITINKGDYKDFARLLQKLPEGFTATEVERDDAKFLFENGEVKFIWFSAPAKSELKVSYRVTVAPDASGEKQITGKFSYLENGTSTAITSDPVTIMISNESVNATANTNTTTTVTTTPVIPVDTMGKPATDVEIKRSMPPKALNTFDVDITINKDDIRSFAKYEETLPDGFTATATNTDGAKFSKEGQKIKFVWYNLPTKKVLHISYKVVVDAGISGNKSISGNFSYLENEKNKTTDIAASAIEITLPFDAVATNTTTSGNNSADTSKNTGDGNKTPDNGNNNSPVNENTTTVANTNTTSGDGGNKTPDTGNNTAANTTSNTAANVNSTPASGDNTNATATNNASAANENKTPVTTIPSAENGLSFRVQIAALSRNASPSEFTNRFGLSDRVDAEQHDGLNKYLVGNFTAYQEARNKREDIRGKGASDAFVTAYNSGRRITVQEALMISKQPWVR